MDEMGFVTWKLVQLVLWAGPFGVAAFLAAIAATAFYAGYSMRPKRTDKPMQAAKLDHIKYDILPDGTLGPGDNRNLEGPE
jgi:hypothetical protein